jgi:hypothetical protein
LPPRHGTLRLNPRPLSLATTGPAYLYTGEHFPEIFSAISLTSALGLQSS